MPDSISGPPHDAMERLYHEHHGWLVQLLRRKLGNLDHAADLTHDVFERIMRTDLAPVMEAPRAYLTTVAQRLAISHFRRAAIEQAVLDALASRPESTAPSPEQLLQLQQSLLAVTEVLDGLPLRTRRIFLMAQFDGLSQGDIARQLGITPNAVQKAMARALEHCYLAIYAPLP